MRFNGLLIIALFLCAVHAVAEYGVTPQRIEASSTRDPRFAPENAGDGNWVSRWQAKDEGVGAWIKLSFDHPVNAGAVMLIDRAEQKGTLEAVRFDFSDGGSLDFKLPTSPAYVPEQNRLLYQPVDTGMTAKSDKGAHFIRFLPRKTTFVKLTVTAITAGANASLAELRVIAVPEDDNQPQADTGEMMQITHCGYALSTTLPEAAWHFTNDEFSLQVSPSSGLITRLTSLKPTPVEFIPADGLVLYLRNIERKWEDHFTQLKAWHAATGMEEGQPYQELTCIVAPTQYRVAYARLRYRIFPDRVEFRVEFIPLVDDWCRYRVGWYNHLSATDWPRHRDCGGISSTTLHPVYAPPYIRAYSHAYDICWEEGSWTSQVFPMGYFQRDDRFLMYGSFDLGPHLVFAPHIPVENAYPSLFVMPFGLHKNQTFTFEMFFKSFDRRSTGRMEMLRWYGEHTHFDDPALHGIPVRLTQHIPRTLAAGRLVSGGQRMPGVSAAQYQDNLAWMSKVHMNNLWYGGWDIWVHPPEDFSRGTWNGYAGKLSAETMQQEIVGLKVQGLHPYIYMNNFVTPPWVPVNAEGGRLIDPDDARKREWYLQRAKAMIDFYQPAGIAWDCGWWPLGYAAPNYNISANPRGDTLKGWLKIQAEMYRWLRENHPDMHVTMNLMSGCSPSQFFTDAVTLEGALSPEVVEESKAFMTAVVSLHTPISTMEQLKTYGLTEQQIVNEPLPAAVSTDLWLQHMRYVLPGLAAGASLGGDPATLTEGTPEQRKGMYGFRAHLLPLARQTRELAQFCALANATPDLPESFVLTSPHPALTGNVWASETRLLACVYYQGKDPLEAAVTIHRNILRKYRSETLPAALVQIIGPDGCVLPGRTLSISIDPDEIHLNGKLNSGEMALMTAPSL